MNDATDCTAPRHVRLKDCPPGMFVFENRHYLRTVHGEAYDCRDGAHFWGIPEIYIGSREMTELMKDLGDIMVRPLSSNFP